jgi:hypothetical protein
MLGAFEEAHDSAHALVDDYYSRLQAGELHAQLHQRLSAGVRQALKKARGRLASFQKQVGSGCTMPQCEALGVGGRWGVAQEQGCG